MNLENIKQFHIIAHSITVWNIMKDWVIQQDSNNMDYAEEMFVLWYCHDIWKELWYWESHAQRWWELLHKLWFKYWKEVSYHGQINVWYHSPELDLLNYADLQTAPNWSRVSVGERLEDIGNRYWFDSKVYNDAKVLASRLWLL